MRLNQTVALKVLPERCLDDSQAVARFQREMQSVGSLDHPNIVRAFNAGEDRGSHFLVMEFVEGLTLDELGSKTNGELPIGAACEMIRQAALGLQHAYEHGLVHRDIKPANLMLSRSGVVKILDLGLARLRNRSFSHTLTQTGMAMGTPDFMAPEQCHDASTVDIRADIYSLGCTLYFLLTSRPPYAGPDYETIGRKLMAHATAPLPSVAAERRDCPDDIDRILAHMMAKEPDERFDTPGELADAIGLFADRDELLAAIPGTEVLDQSTVASHPGIKSAEVDTPKRPSRDSSPRKLGGPHWRPKQPWYRTARGMGAIGLLAAALLVGGVWRLVFSPTPDPKPPGIEPPEKSEVEPGTPSAEPPRPNAARLRFADEVCILPGLNGEWWFDEMPWLVPFVRQATAEQLLEGTGSATLLAADALSINPALDADTDKAKEWLRSQVDAARQQQRFSAAQEALLEELLGIPAAGSDREALRKILEQAYQRFEQAHAGGEWSAVDLHTCAVLQHTLAQTSESTHTPQAALERYGQAREAYAKLAPRQRGLERLCLLDLGWFQAQFVNDYDEMMRCFTEAMDGAESPFVEAQVLVAQGRAACTKDNYAAGDLAYASAIKKTKETYLDEISHPLVASLNERYAWSLIYQWKVAAATERFSEARSIRIRGRETVSWPCSSDSTPNTAWRWRTGTAEIWKAHGASTTTCCARCGDCGMRPIFRRTRPAPRC